MRKIILSVAVTLDGFIEGPNGEYDWCFTDQDYGMNEFLKRIDAIFYGRKTYEMMMGAEGSWKNPFGRKKNYVFSNTWKNAPAGIEMISGNVAEQVQQIKSQQGKDIWLFGGASLTCSLMSYGLVDELGLAVHPVLLGKGKPLFSNVGERINTKLLDTRSYPTGLVSLHYEIVK